jgi:hypothetical protein
LDDFDGLHANQDRGDYDGDENADQDEQRRSVQIFVQQSASNSQDYEWNGHGVSELPGQYEGLS